MGVADAALTTAYINSAEEDRMKPVSISYVSFLKHAVTENIIRYYDSSRNAYAFGLLRHR